MSERLFASAAPAEGSRSDADSGARISVIIPVLDESLRVEPTLTALAPLRAAGHEVIVVDGGSVDDTPQRCTPLVDKLLTSAAGRARQMNVGAAEACGELLWFLHADTLPPPDVLQALQLTAEKVVRQGDDSCLWGRFDIRIDGAHPRLPMVAWWMNLRSRVSGVMTGDQGLFLARTLFRRSGGFLDIPLMEDVEYSKRLRRVSRPLCLRNQLLTSGRRWETEGLVKTILLMWGLRLAYVVGISPERLADWYYPQRKHRTGIRH